MSFTDEKHEFLGWLIVLFGFIAVGLDWTITYKDVTWVLSGALLIMGVKHLKDLKAGEIGFDNSKDTKDAG